MLDAGASAMSGAARGVNFLTNSTGLGLYFSSEVAKMHKHRGRSGALRLENGGAYGGGCFVLTPAMSVAQLDTRAPADRGRLGRQELPGGRRLRRRAPAAARKPAQPGRAATSTRPPAAAKRWRCWRKHPLRRGAVRLQPRRRQERPAGAGRSAHAQPAAAVSSVWMMVSAEKSVESVMGAAEHQPDAYLIKPITEGVLLTRLNRVWHKKQVFRAIDQAYAEKDYLRAARLCDEQIEANKRARDRAAAHEGGADAQERRAGQGARSLRARAGAARIPVGARRAGQDPHGQRRVRAGAPDVPGRDRREPLLHRRLRPAGAGLPGHGQARGSLRRSSSARPGCRPIRCRASAAWAQVCLKLGNIGMAEKAFRKCIAIGEYSVREDAPTPTSAWRACAA